VIVVPALVLPAWPYRMVCCSEFRVLMSQKTRVCVGSLYSTVYASYRTVQISTVVGRISHRVISYFTRPRPRRSTLVSRVSPSTVVSRSIRLLETARHARPTRTGCRCGAKAANCTVIASLDSLAAPHREAQHNVSNASNVWYVTCGITYYKFNM
jgi:hypothetical protein